MEKMENKPNELQPTKDAEKNTGILLSNSDAEEYRAYKKQKKISEITSAFARTETPLELKSSTERVCEHAIRLRQAAIKVNLRKLMQMKDRFSKTAIKLDCAIGVGETVVKIKAQEIRLAKRMHAGEVSVEVPPSLLATCRFAEIKRELKKLKRVAKKTVFKVCVDKNYPYDTIARVARMASDIGAQYFSVPYFPACEKLRMDLVGGCKLEVSEVENLADFKKMIGAGVGRVVTTRVWELYSEWMKETEKIVAFAPKTEEEKLKKEPLPEVKRVEHTPLPPALPVRMNPETDYRCRLEGTELKFY
jgi:deoxyribose-phosphate aldolase